MCDIEGDRKCMSRIPPSEHRCLDCVTGEEWNAASAEFYARQRENARGFIYPAKWADGNTENAYQEGVIPMG